MELVVKAVAKAKIERALARRYAKRSQMIFDRTAKCANPVRARERERKFFKRASPFFRRRR